MPDTWHVCPGYGREDLGWVTDTEYAYCGLRAVNNIEEPRRHYFTREHSLRNRLDRYPQDVACDACTMLVMLLDKAP